MRSFEIIAEGKLLIDHLDHKRAKEIDVALYGGQVNPDVDPSDRSQYRGGISERESDIPIEPIHFTHFFDKFKVVVYTVWQPVDTVKLPSKRQKGKRQLTSFENSLLREFIGLTAFVVPYTCPKAPSLKCHSVMVELQLWLRLRDDTPYQLSPLLAKALFPQHINESTQNTTERVKKKTRTTMQQQQQQHYSSSSNCDREKIPTLGSVFVPSFLTLIEITTAIFHYIQFKKLQDEHEQSMIQCDKKLQLLFDCENFNFADLQFLLTNKHLILDASTMPSSFTYTIDQSSNSKNKSASDHQKQKELSLDIDVNVPSLFHYRCRELLRRIKQREFEYTSSRTKARNWMMSGRPSEDRVRQLLEDCVTGHGYTSNHIGAWSALARAAPHKSEARQTAQIDAQICYLLDRVEHHAKAAKVAWNVARAISGRNFDENEEESHDGDEIVICLKPQGKENTELS